MKKLWDSLDTILKDIDVVAWGMVASEEFEDRVQLHREITRLALKARLAMIRECKECKLGKY